MVPVGVLCSDDNLSECRGCTCKSILGDHWASWRGQPANIECLTSTSIQLTGTIQSLSIVDHSMLLSSGLTCLLQLSHGLKSYMVVLPYHCLPLLCKVLSWEQIIAARV